MMRKKENIRRKLSIILPVYNEKDSFPIIMDKLLNKQLKRMFESDDELAFQMI